MIGFLLIVALIVAAVILFGKTAGRNDTASFEAAFLKRMGQCPTNYVANKLASGSDLDSVRYLFDIISAELETKHKCKSPGFDFYYNQALKQSPTPLPTAPTPPQSTYTGSPQYHRWTAGEEMLCCRMFFQEYVVEQRSTDLQQFAEQLHQILPAISVGSLKMKAQNNKHLCITHGIKDSLKAQPLSGYSQQNLYIFRQVKREFGY